MKFLFTSNGYRRLTIVPQWFKFSNASNTLFLYFFMTFDFFDALSYLSFLKTSNFVKDLLVLQNKMKVFIYKSVNMHSEGTLCIRQLKAVPSPLCLGRKTKESDCPTYAHSGVRFGPISWQVLLAHIPFYFLIPTHQSLMLWWKDNNTNILPPLWD